jgi:hypothetical protein
VPTAFYLLIRSPDSMTAAPGITHTEVEDLIRRTTDSTLERALTLKLRGDDALRVVNGLQRVRDYHRITLAECL